MKPQPLKNLLLLALAFGPFGLLSPLLAQFQGGTGVILNASCGSLGETVTNFNRSNGTNTVTIEVSWSVDINLAYSLDVECFVGISIEVEDFYRNAGNGIGTEAFNDIVRWQNPINLYDDTELEVEYDTPWNPLGCYCKSTIIASGLSTDPYGSVELNYTGYEHFLYF